MDLHNDEDVPKGLIAYKVTDIARHRQGATDRDEELSRARYAFGWKRKFELSLDPERGDYHDENLPPDIYKQGECCSICGP